MSTAPGILVSYPDTPRQDLRLAAAFVLACTELDVPLPAYDPSARAIDCMCLITCECDATERAYLTALWVRREQTRSNELRQATVRHYSVLNSEPEGELRRIVYGGAQ